MICAETREIWKKSGAWFFKSLPKYTLPSPAGASFNSKARNSRYGRNYKDEDSSSDDDRKPWSKIERRNSSTESTHGEQNIFFVIKNAQFQLALPLMHIFNLCFSEGGLPDLFIFFSKIFQYYVYIYILHFIQNVPTLNGTAVVKTLWWKRWVMGVLSANKQKLTNLHIQI